MLFFFRSKSETTSRNYDVIGNEFTPLPLKPNEPVSDSQKFQWNVGLVKDLCAIFSAIFLAAIAYGIMMVLIALRLEAYVKNEVLMSISIATQIGAGVIFSRFLPSMGKKTGMVNSVYLGSILSAVCSLCLYKYIGFLPWLMFIFCIGTSFFICGVTRNTIMIDLAPAHMRAMIISFGGMLVALGNSLGPITLEILKTSDSFTSFAVASGFFLASTIPLARLKKVEAKVREEKKISLGRYIMNSPKIMLAAFSTSFAMSSASSFLIIYGIKIGMPKNEASLLLSVLLFGTIFSIPISYLADILNRRLMMITSAALALCFALLLYFNQDPYRIYILSFCLFGSLSGIKLTAVVLINEKYKPTQRLAVNSAFARFSLIGNICGLFTTGATMKDLGPEGLWLSVSTILLLFLLFCLANYTKKFLRKEFKFQDFSILNKHQNEQLSES